MGRTSAAALWGSRAANGVIVITTKDGLSGDAKITYSSTISFDEVSERIPMQTMHGAKVEEAFMVQQEQSLGEIIYQAGQEVQILLILLVDFIPEPKQEQFTIQLLLRTQEKLL